MALIMHILLFSILLSLNNIIFVSASLYSSNVDEEIKHVETVNKNFQKLDESLRLVNENFVLLDAKTGDNSKRVNSLAAETKKAFTQMSEYFKNIQQQIDELRQAVQLINERFGNTNSSAVEKPDDTTIVAEL